MKFRKPASAALAAAMLVSSVGIVSYAELDEEMKQELTVVKERIDVPEALSGFSYTTSTEYGKKYYKFNWQNPDGAQYLRVTVCGKIITEYRYDDYTASSEWDERYTFAKLTKEEIVKRAKEELQKLNPTVANNIEISEDGVRISLYSNSAGVPIYRVRDGVRVAGQSGQINIDKNTGALLSYHLTWTPGAGFRSAEEAISKEEAIAGYREVFPLEKRYVTKYDWETKEYTPYLIFRRADVGQIDAFTGKKATFSESYDYYENDIAADEGADSEDDGDDANPSAGGGVSFTDEELEKLETEERLIKPEKALEDMISSGIWSVPKNAEVGTERAYTYFDLMVGAYVREFTIRAYETVYASVDGTDGVPVTAEKTTVKSIYYGNVTMNAETGEILSFSGSDTRTTTRAVQSEVQARSLLNNYLRRILNSRASDFVLDNPRVYYVGRDREGNLTEDSYISTVSVESPRYAYGIPSDREKVSMTIDQSGRVSRYSLNWYGIEYPKPENILSEDEAYTKYFEQIEYKLLYRIAYNRTQKRMETALVYNASDDFRIDAFSGKLVDYYGEEVSVKEKDGYTDLKESGCREEAEKLALYGITLMDEEGRLNADMTITRSDFAKLVRSIGVYYGNVENGERPLTRQYAAKILAGYSKIAELPNLFKSPYSDVSEDDPYVGYIALAVAQGYIKGENGKFRPSAKMTRGDALLLVYDYLNR